MAERAVTGYECIRTDIDTMLSEIITHEKNKDFAERFVRRMNIMSKREDLNTFYSYRPCFGDDKSIIIVDY